MTDQCKHCTYRGDIKACLAAECSQHENWYAKEQQAQIDKLNKVVKAADILAMRYTDLMAGNVDSVRFAYSEEREALEQLKNKE